MWGTGGDGAGSASDIITPAMFYVLYLQSWVRAPWANGARYDSNVAFVIVNPHKKSINPEEITL